MDSAGTARTLRADVTSTPFSYNPNDGTLTTGGQIINTGNLHFSSSAQRISGDFSGATISNRLLLQTSTTNANSNVGIIPNGSGSTSSLQIYPSSDPNNSSILAFAIDNSRGYINSSISGAGTLLPIDIRVNNSTALTINTSQVCDFTNVPTCSVSASTTNQLVNWNNFATITNYDPVLQDSGGNLLLVSNYTTRIGKYIKIGNLVWFQLRIAISAKANLVEANQLQITIPITSSAITNLSQSLVIGNITNMTTSIVSAFAQIPTSSVNYFNIFFKTAASTGTSTTLVSNISTTFQISVGGFYFA